MIRSMTGFARVERQFDFGRLSWELRTVNHRYLEISIRVPEEFRAREPAMREMLGHHVSRGKLDATLRYHAAAGGSAGDVRLNQDFAKRLLKLQAELSGLAGADTAPRPEEILRWPGVVEEILPDPKPLQEAAMDLLEETATELRAAREREGDAIASALGERLDGIARWSAEIKNWLPEIREGLRTRLLDRIGDLEQPLDPGRLEQEVAFLAQKIDVDEELDRLDAHVEESRRVLDRDDPVGRRLDFLMQEFNRESNTLSSKSVDVRTSKAAVELKVLIEQMREQVQNVE
jgi:uncharacterized protein (TIGR00255 family)